MNTQRRLINRVALVTGASSGIGEATAIALHREGARVALLSRRLEALSGLADRLGDGALPIAVDVSDEGGVAEAVELAWDRLGPISVVVNSAGVCLPCSVTSFGSVEWEQTIAVNLSGTYFVSRHAGLRMLAAKGGTIINVGSELGVIGAAGYAAYCASKAGVAGLTRALAAEFAPSVTVNVVSPGPVDTPMFREEMARSQDPDALLASEIARVPLRRLAVADEVAKAVLYLALDGAYATGMTLALDGGTTVT
jgi:NAD(P)-dependent dehydrogenase (short-subunit alcohol dehydrogenase family)